MGNDDHINRLPTQGMAHGGMPSQYGGSRQLGWNVPDQAASQMLPEEEEAFNPLQILLYVVRYRWLIAALLILGLVFGFLVTLAMAPKYKAQAMIEIAPPTAQIIQDLQITSESSDLRTFQTALEKLRSRQMMRRVVHDLGLTQRKNFLFPNSGFSLSNLLGRAFGRMGVKNPMEELDAQERENTAIERITKGLSVKLLRKTRIISISYSSTNPDYARLIANQFANSYIASNLDQSSETSRLARQFISEQVADIKQKLEKAEKALVEYAKTAGITLSGKEGSLVSSNIRDINEALSKAIQDRLKYERLVRQVKSGRTMELEAVIDSEAIQKQRAKIVELQAEYQQKLRTFKPSYPEMRQLKAQITELRRLLRQDVKGIANGIRLKYKVAVEKERNLRDKLKELEAQQAAYQDKNIKYTILKREVDSYRSQYQSLIDKLNKLGVASEIRNKSASIVEYATTPNKPYSPSLLKNLALAFVLSGGLAAAVIYILELMNNTFANPDQLEAELNLPVLGILPKIPGDKLQELLDDPRSNLSEAFRTLRTSLQFTGINGAPRSLMVTSTEPGEGKSTISRKLAEEFGALGLNVLLIDADMRKPVQHRHAGIPNSLGLSNLLTNTVPESQAGEEVEIMRNTPWANVWLVTAGTLPPNPANLLASQKMGMFIEACCNRFDIVIIDSPPVIGLADALLLSRLAEATVLTVASQQVARKGVQNALKKLRAAAGHVVGTVLNRFEMDRMEYKYSYKYMNYGYLSYEGSYGYGGEPDDEAISGKKRGKKGSKKKHAADSNNRNGDGGAFARLFGRGRGDRTDQRIEPVDDDGSGHGRPSQPPEHGSENKPAA